MKSFSHDRFCHYLGKTTLFCDNDINNMISSNQKILLVITGNCTNLKRRQNTGSIQKKSIKRVDYKEV